VPRRIQACARRPGGRRWGRSRHGALWPPACPAPSSAFPAVSASRRCVPSGTSGLCPNTLRRRSNSFTISGPALNWNSTYAPSRYLPTRYASLPFAPLVDLVYRGAGNWSTASATAPRTGRPLHPAQSGFTMNNSFGKYLILPSRFKPGRDDLNFVMAISTPSAIMARTASARVAGEIRPIPRFASA